MTFEIEDSTGRVLTVEAVDWMIAMVRATDAFGVSPSGFDCEHRQDGSVHVADPRSGEWWLVRSSDPDGSEATATSPPPASVGPATLARGARMPPRARPYRTPVRKPLWSPDSAPRAPEGDATRGPAMPSPNLAERLFELAREIQGQPDPKAAADHTLRVAAALVPCEAGSVLRAGDDEGFEFFSVFGEAEDLLLGRRVPLGQGIVGAAYAAGVTVRVEDASRDPRHLSEIDQETGFDTRSILCVPIRSESGFHGVIELLNPKHPPFDPWQIDVVESLASALAEAVAE